MSGFVAEFENGYAKNERRMSDISENGSIFKRRMSTISENGSIFNRRMSTISENGSNSMRRMSNFSLTDSIFQRGKSKVSENGSMSNRRFSKVSQTSLEFKQYKKSNYWNLKKEILEQVEERISDEDPRLILTKEESQNRGAFTNHVDKK